MAVVEAGKTTFIINKLVGLEPSPNQVLIDEQLDNDLEIKTTCLSIAHTCRVSRLYTGVRSVIVFTCLVR